MAHEQLVFTVELLSTDAFETKIIHCTVQLTLDEMELRVPEPGLPDYVVVEGPIGVGKSTLARSLAHSFKYDLLLERPEDNPFLSRFYQDRAAFALQTQLSFLFQRSRQMEDIHQGDLFSSKKIADFMLEKDPLFAEVTLDQHELDIYTKVYEHVITELHAPDLVIYLQAPVSVLSGRVKRRGVDAEQQITSTYLEALNNAYMNFFHQYSASPLLIVNATEIDFAHNPHHYRDLVDRILQMGGGTHYYNPITKDI